MWGDTKARGELWRPAIGRWPTAWSRAHTFSLQKLIKSIIYSIVPSTSIWTRLVLSSIHFNASQAWDELYLVSPKITPSPGALPSTLRVIHRFGIKTLVYTRTIPGCILRLLIKYILLLRAGQHCQVNKVRLVCLKLSFKSNRLLPTAQSIY